MGGAILKIPTEQAPAGPWLDAAAAEVMGWRLERWDDQDWWVEGDGDRYILVSDSEDVRGWHPSEDIAAAFELVAWMRASGWYFHITDCAVFEDWTWLEGDQIAVVFGRPGSTKYSTDSGIADTIPLAISRAFLFRQKKQVCLFIMTCRLKRFLAQMQKK